MSENQGMKDMDKEGKTKEDVLFHHSNPLDSSIHCPPSLSDSGYFLRPNSCFRASEIPRTNVHFQASISENEKKTKKNLKAAGNCKVGLSAAFHATAWQKPMVG